MRSGAMRIAAYNLLPLAVAIFIVYHTSGMRDALAAIPIGAAMELVASAYELRLGKKLSNASELDDTLFALHFICMGVRYGGKSVHASMDGACAELRQHAGKAVYETFDEMRRRLELGEDLKQSIDSLCRSGKSASLPALELVGKEYERNPDAVSAIKNVYDRLCKEQLVGREEAYGSLQKYLTISMALSTVLPSFVVFAFVGYSMVYYSESLLLLFSLLMLIMLPKLYALLRMHIAGIYAQ